MPQINEFTMNLPMMSAGGAEPAPAVETVSTYPEISIVDQDRENDCMSTVNQTVECNYSQADISVFPVSMTMVNSAAENGIATFDLTFSVGIYDGTVSKTYQVVKTIGIDKMKIAKDAESKSLPVTIVETQLIKEETAKHVSRFRTLAGLE